MVNYDQKQASATVSRLAISNDYMPNNTSMLCFQEKEQRSDSSDPREQLCSFTETNSALSAKQGRCHRNEVAFFDCIGLPHRMPCTSHRLGPKGCEHKPVGLSHD